MIDSSPNTIVAIIFFFCAAVAFAAPSLWRRDVMTRLPGSMTRSWPRTRAASIMIGVGMVMEGVVFGFFLPSPDVPSSLDFSSLLLLLPVAILMFAGRVVEGALAQRSVGSLTSESYRV